MRKFQSYWSVGLITGLLLASNPSFVQAQGVPSGSGTGAMAPGGRTQAERDEGRTTTPLQKAMDSNEAEDERKSTGSESKNIPGNQSGSPGDRDREERFPATEAPEESVRNKSKHTGS